jgi:hypothetical protein
MRFDVPFQPFRAHQSFRREKNTTFKIENRKRGQLDISARATCIPELAKTDVPEQGGFQPLYTRCVFSPLQRTQVFGVTKSTSPENFWAHLLAVLQTGAVF